MFRPITISSAFWLITLPSCVGATNPWFLLFATLCVIPVIIHLINFRRAREVEFPSIRLLEIIEKQLARKQRLREILLLVCRSLLILLIVLLISNLVWSNDEAAAQDALALKDRVLVIDDTHSTALTISGKSAFDLIREKAAEYLIAAEGEKVFIVTVAGGTPTAAGGSMRAEAALSYVRRMKPLPASGDLFAAIRAALKHLESAGPRAKEILILSDLQRATWSSLLGRELEIPSDAKLYAVDCSSDANAGLALTSLSASSHLVCAGVPFEVVVGLANPSSETTSDAITLYAGDSVIEVRQVNLESQESRFEKFEVTLKNEGFDTLRASVADGSLAQDDQIFGAVEVIPDIPVLMVYDEPGDAHREASFFLKAALRSDGFAGNDAEYRISEIPQSSLLDARLSDFRLVVFPKMDVIPVAAGDEIARYLRAGGRMMIFPGENIDDAEFNESFFGEYARIGPPIESENLKLMPWLRSGYPPFERLREADLQSILGPPEFRKAYAIRASDESLSMPSLKFDTNHPAFIEVTTGAGKLVLFAFPGDDTFTNFPAKPVYVPIMRELAKYLCAGRNSIFAATPGAPGTEFGSIRVGLFDAAIPVYDSALFSEFRIASAAGLEESFIWKTPEPREIVVPSSSSIITYSPGVHQVSLPGSAGIENGRIHIVVNPPKNEVFSGRAHTIDISLVGKYLGNNSVETFSANDDFISAMDKSNKPVSLWPIIFILIAIAIAIESWLAASLIPSNFKQYQ
ncbi:MAG: BatA domain-containing protein [Planctomycetes bacterium]|nr:BatA domain-containing protein [Planctomycetota bacterium]